MRERVQTRDEANMVHTTRKSNTIRAGRPEQDCILHINTRGHIAATLLMLSPFTRSVLPFFQIFRHTCVNSMQCTGGYPLDLEPPVITPECEAPRQARWLSPPSISRRCARTFGHRVQPAACEWFVKRCGVRAVSADPKITRSSHECALAAVEASRPARGTCTS